MENTKIKFPIIPVVLCIVFALLARVVGIVYSFLATDVLYSGSLICQLLPSVRQILSGLSFATAAGAAVMRVFHHSTVKYIVLMYSAVLFADGAAVILYDGLSGVLDGRLLFAIIYRLGLILYSVLLLLIGVLAAKAMFKRNISGKRTVAIIAVIPVVIDFVMVVWNCIASLIEMEFLPYTSEVYSMALDVGTVVVTGILSAITAAMIMRKNQNKAKSRTRDTLHKEEH